MKFSYKFPWLAQWLCNSFCLFFLPILFSLPRNQITNTKMTLNQLDFRIIETINHGVFKWRVLILWCVYLLQLNKNVCMYVCVQIPLPSRERIHEVFKTAINPCMRKCLWLVRRTTACIRVLALTGARTWSGTRPPFQVSLYFHTIGGCEFKLAKVFKHAKQKATKFREFLYPVSNLMSPETEAP